MATLAKPNLPRFDVEIFQNEYLADGSREVNAIVTVTATGGGTSGGRPLGITDASAGGDGQSAAVVILVDCSGSMDYPSSKMRGAREATAAAVDTVRDGVAFAVVAGDPRGPRGLPRRRHPRHRLAGDPDPGLESLRRLHRGRPAPPWAAG